MTVSAQPIPSDIVEAMERGAMTREQIERLAEIEAEDLGYSLDDAVELAHRGELPKTPTGTDLLFLIHMLDL